MTRSGTLPSRLTYRLLPEPADLAEVFALLAAYRRMLVLLEEIRREHGLRANVVALIEHGYQRVRDETGLPARLVTLGIRDFAQRAAGFDPETVTSMPLDDKLFSVKGASEIALTTMNGRRTMPYRVEGYDGPWRELSSARLTIAGDALTIQVGVSVTAPQEETRMTENILTRVGRIIGGLSNAALEAVEDRNGLAVAEQALREIDAVIHEARLDLGKIKAEEHRLSARRGQLDGELRALPEKLSLALSNGREDLARAGIARQLDLESQIEAIDSSLADVAERHGAATKAMQAATAARRDAEHRIALLRKPPAKAADPLDGYGSEEATRTRQLEQSLRAIDRVTGTASAVADPSVEELDRLHRDDAIERRLAALKQSRPS
ncbi:PspA/IM30 family protein [Methylorubrum extorquens]|uniref:PspA/IM30 family protein n=1 Tax=Methylorubrum extorquens TaxID=408 RepID=UPI002238DFB1|nr:PspA/IM30 family protein [Methylorubrum extorquens]UYW26877.1 PspA/IM30 family protein [Methylorubrum extorquens]UYW33255.1 PspA/IM30 family protein [Methylorubrum extorquens]